MRQLICRRTCEWLEIGYTYRAVRISYLLRLAEVAHIHIGYCKITTCYRARPDKRAQRCSVFSNKNIFINYVRAVESHHLSQRVVYMYITRNRSLSNIGRARCAAINSDFFKIIISKYINYTIGINDNNCVFVCNLILGW